MITGSFAHAYSKTGFLDMADITLVPYGNASETGPDANGQYSFTCQHGPTECQYNFIESCGLNLIENPLTSFNFVNCIENNDDSRSTDQDYDSVVDTCTAQAGCASQSAQIKACYKGTQGNAYEHTMAVMTNSLNPAHTYVPYVVGKNGHNDTVQDAVQQSLFLYVCFEYTGPNKSLECLLAEEEYKLTEKVEYPVCHANSAALFLN